MPIVIIVHSSQVTIYKDTQYITEHSLYPTKKIGSTNH